MNKIAKRVEKSCETCQITRKALPSDKRKYCSRKCYTVWQSKQKKPQEWKDAMYALLNRRITMNCLFCLKKYETVPCKFHKNKYCSQKCWREFIKTKREKTICGFCKKEVLVSKSRLNLKFCSVRCRGLGKRGKNSPVFKGVNAISKLRVRLSGTPEHKVWHASVLKRDNYTCQICNIRKIGRNIILEVDHIKPIYEICFENKTQDIEVIRYLPITFDIKNGRTLCKMCHKSTHSSKSGRTYSSKYSF